MTEGEPNTETAAKELVPVPQAPISGELPSYELPTQPAWSEGLTPKQRLFVEEYLGESRFSAAAAARKVGISEGYGAALRSDPRVIVALERCLSESGIARQRVLQELGALAFSSLSDVVDWKDGKMVVRDSASLSDEARRSITRVKCDPVTGLVTEVGCDLKGPALTALAKALRLAGGPDMAITVSPNVTVVLSKEDQAVL